MTNYYISNYLILRREQIFEGRVNIKAKININKKELIAYCEKSGIKSLSLFGSVLREDFNSESDIDILVQFEEGKVPGLIGFVRIQNELSEFFEGYPVDMVTLKALRGQNRKKEILESSEVFYAKAS